LKKHLKKRNLCVAILLVIVAVVAVVVVAHFEGYLPIPGLNTFPSAQPAVKIGYSWIYQLTGSYSAVQQVFTVTSIQGTIIFLHVQTQGGSYVVSVDVSNPIDPQLEGDSNVLIRGGCNIGDLVLQDPSGTDGRVSAVVLNNYWGQLRPTCVVSLTVSSYPATTVYTYYFDQQTGIMCARHVVAGNINFDTTLTTATVPEFSSLLLVMFLCLSSGLVGVFRKRRVFSFRGASS
jgi:hypothetical protein